MRDFYSIFGGVIHDGINPFPQVIPFMNELIAQNKKVIFLSNAPRPGSLLIQKLRDLGIHVAPDMMLSSGDVVRSQLLHFSDSVFKTLGKRFYHLGAERNQDILSGLEVEVTEHDSFLKKALEFNLALICANPDIKVSHGHKMRYCAGILAKKYEKLGGVVHYYGKPYGAIFETAIQILKEKGDIDKKKILMVGDTLETDIQGANNAGIDSALVLTGNMGRQLVSAREDALAKVSDSESFHFNTENYLKKLFKEANCYPTWILSRLA